MPSPDYASPQRSSAIFALFVLLAILSFSVPASAAQKSAPTMASAERYIRSSNWPKAIAAFEKITAAEPENGLAWFYLSYSHHNTGDLAKAIEFGEKAAKFPEVRGTTLYNMACAHSVLNDLEKSAECLTQAKQAGYLDFDSMEVDPELENLRDEVDLHFPKKHKYTILRGRNKVEIPYVALLPEGFDAEKEYSVAVSFSPAAGGRRTTDWLIDEMWGGKSIRSDWIVICAVAPKKGWINHPSHHALEDLFKKLRKDYHVASNKFHLVGFGNGARVAAIYSGMSEKYTASVTAASATCFSGWDDRDFRRMKKTPVHQLVGGKAEYLCEFARAAQAGFIKQEVAAQLSEIKDDGVLLESLHHGKILDKVAEWNQDGSL